MVTSMTSSSATSFARSARSCHRLYRVFPLVQSSQMSSKRKMQTSTAYHPKSFDTQPPPPRNSGVSETSIAGGIPQINETRPPQHTVQSRLAENPVVDNTSDVGITEREAQTSKPPVTEPPSARPTRKLRPRKAAMKLTPTAVQQLRALLSQPSPKLIKVGVRNRGCSGLAYHLEYVEKPGTFDEAVEQDGVKVLIDSKALFSIIGSEMDWVEDKLSQRFVFRNPNISQFSLDIAQ